MEFLNYSIKISIDVELTIKKEVVKQTGNQLWDHLLKPKYIINHINYKGKYCICSFFYCVVIFTDVCIYIYILNVLNYTLKISSIYCMSFTIQ